MREAIALWSLLTLTGCASVLEQGADPDYVYSHTERRSYLSPDGGQEMQCSAPIYASGRRGHEVCQ